MIKTVTENYLLSPILDHKEKYDLGGVEILIAKDYENNLRRRNCQLGIVEAITKDNPLGLTLGDIVFVNHFTFHGDIGHGRTFKLRPYAEVEGKKLFRVPARNIYFKYNQDKIEAIPNSVVVEGMSSPTESKGGLELISTPYKDRGRIIYASDMQMVGKVVFVEKNALYPIELKDNLYKIYENEIVGYLDGDILTPAEGRVLLEDHEEEKESDLDLSMVKKPTTIKSKVIRCGKLDEVQKLNDWIKEGDIVLRFRNYGIKYENQVVVALADDNIHGVCQ